MEKTLTVKIDNKGHHKGTVGWLLDIADHIEINKTKSGERGAWLKDKAGETICPLVINNWYDNGELAVVREWNPSDYGGYYLTVDFQMSAACMDRVREIAEKVKVKMVELFETDSEKQLIIA